MAAKSTKSGNVGGRRPPIPPALELKLKARAQAHGHPAPPGGAAPERGGRAVRSVRHQGR